MHITDTLPGESRAKLVFGLDWRAYSAKGKKDVRGRYAEDFSASHYVEMQAGDAANGGFCALDADDLKDSVLYSGAARVAMLERVKAAPAVLVLMPDSQRVYLVYVVNGAVHNDEVLTLDQVNKRRADILEQAGKQGLTPVVMISTGYGRTGDSEFDPADLLTLKKVGRIRRVPVGIPTAVVMVAVIGLMGLCVKMGLGAFSPSVVSNTQGPTWAEQYATAVQTTFAGAVPQARFAAPQTLAAFDTWESNTQGWQYDHAKCAAPGSCVVTYGRMGGSFAEFMAVATPSMQPITLARDGQSLTVHGPQVPKVAAVDPAQTKNWLTEQKLIERLQSPVQRMATKETNLAGYGYSVQVGESQPIMNVPQPANEPRQAVIRSGTWEINGYRWQSELLDDLPSNMSLEELTVTLDQAAPLEAGGVGIKFTAKGKYYVAQ